ncbi:Aste57867_12131 [Aphanomyces stellatus]|uniref:Aste57867_12131 protein n=1 Tax=Aphanomyces stellatus TaxID=120398 RepID=A0A485KVJ4_9STRA|nr:hypothetical protein As57867_012086 [Aphanomyces stellatus]VFT88985.1 Aste57867_12131 [Aphanomyces stellatus]
MVRLAWYLVVVLVGSVLALAVDDTSSTGLSKKAPPPKPKPPPPPPPPRPAPPKSPTSPKSPPSPVSRPVPPAPKPPPAPGKRPPTAAPVPPVVVRPVTPKPRATRPPTYVVVRYTPVRPRRIIRYYIASTFWDTVPCAYNTCSSDYFDCVDLFGTCTCFAGLLSCVQTKCAIDWTRTQAECARAKSISTACSVNCSPSSGSSSYPTVSTTLSYSVWIEVTITGATAESFDGYQYAYLSALADVASTDALNVTIDMVYIQKTSDELMSTARRLDTTTVDVDSAGHVLARRELVNAPSPTVLVVLSVVLLNSQSDMDDTAAVLATYMNTTESDPVSANATNATTSTTTSTNATTTNSTTDAIVTVADPAFATALVTNGVLFDPSQLVVTAVYTKIDVVPSATGAPFVVSTTAIIMALLILA